MKNLKSITKKELREYYFCYWNKIDNVKSYKNKTKLSCNLGSNLNKD